MLQDTFGRTIDNLRISLTDRCNLRCRYCMPPEGHPTIESAGRLSRDEIVRIARCFLELGGRSLRLTGGEPLLRRDLPDIVTALASLPGLARLGLTTNGLLFADVARTLWNAGLRRVNISLDSTQPVRFQWMTGSAALRQVLRSVEAAVRCGYHLKVNCVATHGITRADVLALAALAPEYACEVRFIEFMPLCGSGWHPELCFPMQTVRTWIGEAYPLIALPRGTSPAASYQLVGGAGRVGFIESLSHPFCGDCSRVRLTADGKIRLCLFSDLAVDLRSALRQADDTALRARLQLAVQRKPAGHGTVPLSDWHRADLPAIRAIGG